MQSSCRILLWAKPIRFSSILKDGLTLAVAEGSDVVICSEIGQKCADPQSGVMRGWCYAMFCLNLNMKASGSCAMQRKPRLVAGCDWKRPEV